MRLPSEFKRLSSSEMSESNTHKGEHRDVAHMHTSNRRLASWTTQRLRLGSVSTTLLLQTAAPHPVSVKPGKERYKDLMA